MKKMKTEEIPWTWSPAPRLSAFAIFLNFIFGIGLLAAKMSYLVIKKFFPQATDEDVVDKKKFEE